MNSGAIGSQLCRHNKDAIWYRDQNLVEDLLGKASFVEVLFQHALGRPLGRNEAPMIDAILVTLMEHGFTPSSIATRLIYMSAPEAMQAAIAAGLLGVGSQFIGSMENCAGLLTRIASGEADPAALVAEARARREHVPGFGHHLHSPDDPRSIALLSLAEHHGVAAGNISALHRLSAAIDRAAGQHITINATGAIAAILSDMGVPIVAMRGFAIVARAAGLMAHIVEEQQAPTGRAIWALVDEEAQRQAAARHD